MTDNPRQDDPDDAIDLEPTGDFITSRAVEPSELATPRAQMRSAASDEALPESAPPEGTDDPSDQALSIDGSHRDEVEVEGDAASGPPSSTVDNDANSDLAAGVTAGSSRPVRSIRADKVKGGAAVVGASAIAAVAATPRTLSHSIPRINLRQLLARPLFSFHLIVTLSVILSVVGLLMVLSASSVTEYASNGSSYTLLTNQLIFVIGGWVLFYVAIRVRPSTIRRLSPMAMAVSTVLLVLVLLVGIEAYGGKRWFDVFGISVQPSELTKVALCCWGAHLLATRRQHRAGLKELMVPLVPVALLQALLIYLEHNLSTTIIIALITASLLWFAGLSMRFFAAFSIVGAALAVFLALGVGYRSKRVMAFLGRSDDTQGSLYQSRQAKFSLADGGFWGRGPGQSRAKWDYLPNAHNDFIFAIIGEELGFIGAVFVIVLFLLFAFVGFRIALRSVDPYLRLLTATITALTMVQAVINIGYVVGILPVTGIQLPLISAGGTSALTTLFMFGLMASAARHEPEAIAALTDAERKRRFNLLRLPLPRPYVRSKAEVLRDRLDQRRSEERGDDRPRFGRRTDPLPRRRASAFGHDLVTDQAGLGYSTRYGGYSGYATAESSYDEPQRSPSRWIRRDKRRDYDGARDDKGRGYGGVADSSYLRRSGFRTPPGGDSRSRYGGQADARYSDRSNSDRSDRRDRRDRDRSRHDRQMQRRVAVPNRPRRMR